MSWEFEKPKFKVGDLVKVIQKIDFMVNDTTVEKGAVGLVVYVDPDDYGFINYWGFDYTVIIKGNQMLFFESELEPYEPKETMTRDGSKFIFLKN